MNMAYPDHHIWLHQMCDIFCADCYGVWRLPAQARIVDGGANVGVFSLHALWKCPSARIVAVEPSPANLAYLRRNLQGYRGGESVTILPGALAACRGPVCLGGGDSDAHRIGTASGVDVEAILLSELLDEPTDLVKLDIEGAEVEVLREARAALGMVSRIVVEYHVYRGARTEMPEMLALLRDGGMDRFRIFDGREFNADSASTPTHCCLVEAWRAAG